MPLKVNASDIFNFPGMLTKGGGVGSPCPPSRSAHVFNAILNIKIILNGKKIVH